MEKSKGILKALPVATDFTFNDSVVYRIVSKKKDRVQYRRIHRNMWKDENAFEKLDKKYSAYPKNPFMKIYEHYGNTEVFDFLPF